MLVALAAGGLIMSSVGIANASTLAASCAGSVSSSNVTWTATSTGGVTPVSFLWGNGSTSASQILSYTPGTYSMSIQATDASSSVATSTCSATVAQQVPSITSFLATPASITAGQSSVLSWVVGNASSTSINNGIGALSSTSVTVTPAVTTTYTLSAANPSGTSTATATVIVNATTTPPSGINAQIQALLAQLLSLKTQLMQLLAQGGSLGTSTVPTIPGLGLGRGHDNDSHFGTSTATSTHHVETDHHATSTKPKIYNSYNAKNGKGNNGKHNGQNH